MEHLLTEMKANREEMKVKIRANPEDMKPIKKG
jgi:hypothetical protein